MDSSCTNTRHIGYLRDTSVLVASALSRVWRMEEKEKTELLGTHNRQDWPRQLFSRDFTRRKRILWVNECKQGINPLRGLGILDLRVRLLRFQFLLTSRITDQRWTQRHNVAASFSLTQ